MSNSVINQLEDKVQGTISLIHSLKQENRKLSNDYFSLKEKLSNYEGKITQLEELINKAEREHKNLEKSIISALSSLDDVEELKRSKSTSTERESDVDIFPKDEVDQLDSLDEVEDIKEEKPQDLEIF